MSHSANAGIYNYNPPDAGVLERVRSIEAVCARHEVNLSAAALQFPLAHPVARAVIPGADTPERMRRNVAHMREAISIDFWQDLKEEKLIRVDAPIPS